VVGGGGGRIEVKDRAGIESVSLGTRPDDRDGVVEFYDVQGNPAGRLDAAGVK
jgi:hypothetical protein